MKKVIINEAPTLVNTVIRSNVRRGGFSSEKASTVSRARMTMRCSHHHCAWEQRFHTELIAGALQADTAQVRVPADSNSITVIAIDNHKAGEIQGQRLDIIRDCSIWKVKQIRWTELELQEQDQSTETAQEFEFRGHVEDQRKAQEARESELAAQMEALKSVQESWTPDQDQIAQKHDELHRPS